MKYKLIIEVEADSEFMLIYAMGQAQSTIEYRGFVESRDDSKSAEAARVHDPLPNIDESNWQYRITGWKE